MAEQACRLSLHIGTISGSTSAEAGKMKIFQFSLFSFPMYDISTKNISIFFSVMLKLERMNASQTYHPMRGVYKLRVINFNRYLNYSGKVSQSGGRILISKHPICLFNKN